MILKIIVIYILIGFLISKIIMKSCKKDLEEESKGRTIEADLAHEMLKSKLTPILIYIIAIVIWLPAMISCIPEIIKEMRNNDG